MAERTLSISIDIVMHEPGPNRHFNEEREVDVPPDYTEQDILPFVRHELERAVTELEERDLGEARAATIIAAMDLRLRVINFLLNNAPHVVRGSPVAAIIHHVIDESNDELFAEYGDDDRMED